MEERRGRSASRLNGVGELGKEVKIGKGEWRTGLQSRTRASKRKVRGEREKGRGQRKL
jgi:hypothetical protein